MVHAHICSMHTSRVCLVLLAINACMLCSSGVLLDLLSPQASTGLDGLANSTVMVSKADAPAVGKVASHTPTKLRQAGGEADGDWQVL